jgi:hypothetical protein
MPTWEELKKQQLFQRGLLSGDYVPDVSEKADRTPAGLADAINSLGESIFEAKQVLPEVKQMAPGPTSVQIQMPGDSEKQRTEVKTVGVPEDIKELMQKITELQDPYESSAQKKQDILDKLRLESERKERAVRGEGKPLDWGLITSVADTIFGTKTNPMSKFKESPKEYKARLAEAIKERQGMQLGAEQSYLDKIKGHLDILKTAGGVGHATVLGSTVEEKGKKGPSININTGQTPSSNRGPRDTTESDVKELAKRIGSAPLELAVRISRFGKKIGGLNNLDSKQDIPGVGQTGSVPTLFLSPEGETTRQETRGLVGDLIKMQSGLAASESEVNRKMQELGLSFGSSDRAFRKGLQNLKEQIEAHLKSVQAGFRPEVIKLYRERNGLIDLDVPPIGRDDRTQAQKDARIRELEAKAKSKGGN